MHLLHHAHGAGELVSFPVGEIRKKVRAFIEAGAYEIQLTAQDTSAWGRDTGTNVHDSLSESCVPPGKFRIRVRDDEPGDRGGILGELVDAFESYRLSGSFTYLSSRAPMTP